MKILAIETATPVCGVALVNDTTLLARESAEGEYLHAERLTLLVEKVLRLSKTPVASLDAVAVSIGPGSFTGLRIGLSVAKGIAYAVEKPVTPVQTLLALARNVSGHRGGSVSGLIVPVIDARRDEVYAAAYTASDKSMACKIPPCALKVKELDDLLGGEQKIILVGTGAAKVYEFVISVAGSAAGSGRYAFPGGDAGSCDPVSVALLGAEQASRGEFADLASLEPTYVKEFYTTMKPLPLTKD